PPPRGRARDGARPLCLARRRAAARSLPLRLGRRGRSGGRDRADARDACRSLLLSPLSPFVMSSVRFPVARRCATLLLFALLAGTATQAQTPDPRVGLRAGVADAGSAIFGLELV